MGALRSRSLLVLATLVVAGCGDDDLGRSERSTTPGTTPGAASTVQAQAPTASGPAVPETLEGGRRLPASLVGRFRERAEDPPDYVWTFSRAGSEDCRRVVRTDRDCYVVRSIDSRRPEDFGIAVSNPPFLVTQQRGGIEASSQCVGEVSTYRVRRAGRRLVFRKAGGCRAELDEYVVDEQLTAMP